MRKEMSPTRPAARKRARRASPVSFDTVRELALSLPGVEEGLSYGTPAFKVRGKLLARLREDGETLVVRVDMMLRDMLMQSVPETFFITDHYRAYPAVLVRLAKVRREQLLDLLEETWRQVAPKRLVQGYERKA